MAGKFASTASPKVASRVQISNVRTWSRKVHPRAFDLADLDVYVLKEHHDIVAAMGRERGSKDRGSWSVVVVLLLVVVAPFFTGLFWSDLEGLHGNDVNALEPDTATTIATWTYALSAVGLLLLAEDWWRRRGRRWLGFDRFTVVFAVLAATYTLWRMSSLADLDVLALAPPSIPAWLTLVLAVALGAAMPTVSRGRFDTSPSDFRVVGPADPAAVRRLVRELEPRRHEKLMDERRRAVDRLHERGLIDTGQATQIRGLPLGQSITLAERPG